MFSNARSIIEQPGKASAHPWNMKGSEKPIKTSNKIKSGTYYYPISQSKQTS